MRLSSYWYLFSLACFLHDVFVTASNLRRVAQNRKSFLDDEKELRDLIIGGQDAPPNRYPFMVSITDKYNKHRCGGTLIARDVVLTAAHCQHVISTLQGHVQIGRYDFSIPIPEDKNDDFDVTQVEIKQVIHLEIHPLYEPTMLRFDYLLLFLEDSSSFSPIKINADGNVPSKYGESLHVMGWGRTESNTIGGSDILQEVEVKYIPNDVCRKSQGFIDGIPGKYDDLIFEDHLCAMDKGEDACYGDSGGPIIIKDSKEARDNSAISDIDQYDDILIGIVSWGFACVSNDFPGVYSRISTEYDWIKGKVCERSSHASESFVCGGDDGMNVTTAPLNEFPVDTSKESTLQSTTCSKKSCGNKSICSQDGICRSKDHESCMRNDECFNLSCELGKCISSKAKGKGNQHRMY